jgi:hypothetical protein
MRGLQLQSIMLGLLVVILVFVYSTTGAAQPFCDFDDGTLQG